MLFLRIFGKALLFMAFVTAAFDGARNVANPSKGFLITSLSTYLQTYFPDAARFFLSNPPAYGRTGVAEALLDFPLPLLFGALGALFFLAGYRRPPPEIV